MVKISSELQQLVEQGARCPAPSLEPEPVPRLHLTFAGTSGTVTAVALGGHAAARTPRADRAYVLVVTTETIP